MPDLGGALTGVLTPLLPPFVALRWGWRTFVVCYGVYTALFALVWQHWAKDRPSHMATEHKNTLVDWCA